MDAYYRENPSLIVIRDRDAISRARPQKYIDREQETLQHTREDNKVIMDDGGADHLEP